VYEEDGPFGGGPRAILEETKKNPGADGSLGINAAAPASDFRPDGNVAGRTKKERTCALV